MVGNITYFQSVSIEVCAQAMDDALQTPPCAHLGGNCQRIK